jgi:hypothetical protein
MYDERVAPPWTEAVPSSLNARTQRKKVAHIAVIAIDSLSYPPATERIMCAGTMLMMTAAAAPAEREPEHSAASSPRNHVADTPNHAGTRQHTSLRLIFEPSALSVFLMTTEVICMPG